MELSACVEPSAASAAAAAQRQRCFWKFSRMRRAEASLPMTRPQPRHCRRHFGVVRPSAHTCTCYFRHVSSHVFDALQRVKAAKSARSPAW